MKTRKAALAGLLATACLGANASFLGITIEGQLSDPFTSQLFANDTAIVGAGEEFTGNISCCGGSTLQYYADVGESSVTIGIRHLGPFGIVFNANPFTWTISGLNDGGALAIPGFELGDVFTQVLWPDDQNPNASWIGWGQDAEVAPLWNPQWDPATGTLTIIATEGFTIPPNTDVFATFDVIIPVPAALPLMLSGLGVLFGVRRRRLRMTG